ncbi:MAG: N-acetylmuramoyl-L-alanine amidase [Clostridia bacterium]|nr:N-acetylmuramoyl-L-alanine amidase [Clostridia bacterium]
MKKSTKINLIVIFFILLMIFLIFIKIKNDNNSQTIIQTKTASLFQNINNTAKVNKYIVYGTHFNLEGSLEIPKISGISIYSAHVVVKNIDEKEISLKCTYTYKDNILSFSTIDKINEGLYLENLAKDKYYVFLKIVFSNSEVKYYSLENASKYEDTSYYTITKNETNNKININFSNYNNLPFMAISVEDIESLPDNVYDIAIDPAHGGKDLGAQNNGYYESDIVLKCAKNLKEKLEKSGYKVYLTRDGSESKTEDMANNMYNENGRINKVQESHAKILISLHVNSNSKKLSKGGVEVYAPSNCNLDFAKLLANNIVKKANTSYSTFSLYKQADGVYVHNFSDAEISAFKSRANSAKYEPYSITKTTPYLYMIRETGGIATNAFVDGRNKNYGTNKYYNSNIGIETYSIELGYMHIDDDLDNILKNENLYMQAISDSFSYLQQQ